MVVMFLFYILAKNYNTCLFFWLIHTCSVGLCIIWQ